MIAALVVGAVTFLAALRLLARRRVRWLARRVVVAAPRVETAEPEETGAVRARLAPLLRATERTLGGSPAWRTLDRLTERAALPLSTAELVWIASAASAGAGLVALAAAGAAGGVAVAALVLLAVPLGLRVRARRRVRRFEAALPELLRAVASALRAGHGFLQALQAVAAEAAEPARTELERVLTQTRLGRTPEQALADLGRRIDSEELRFVLDAVVIQRQVGGSLAGIFEIVAETVAQRQQFALRVRALTAMARSSSTVLMALPAAIGALLTALNPAYMRPLYVTSTGRMLLATAAALMAVGAVWLRRIASPEG